MHLNPSAVQPFQVLARRRAEPSRILFYSHDSYGLGHFRRVVTLARSLRACTQKPAVLCVTGAPRPDLFSLPDGADYVKLPSFTKNSSGTYVPRRLTTSVKETVALRRDIISSVWRRFRPDVVVIDHAPLGLLGEVTAALQLSRGFDAPARVVLGMRDIIDAPARTRAQFQRDGVLEAIRDYYDEVFVYGERHVFDVADEYGLPEEIRRKLNYVGYVCPDVPPTDSADVALDRVGESPNVLVSAGGGGDGYPLLRSVIAALRGPLEGASVTVTLVTGPLMSTTKRRRLQQASRLDSRLRILRRSDDMERLLSAADLVVSMGGYNSVCEGLSRRKRMLLFPRSHPRQEQLERAVRLERRGLVGRLGEETLASPQRLAERVETALAGPPPDPGAQGITFRGAARAAERLEALLAKDRAPTTFCAAH